MKKTSFPPPTTNLAKEILGLWKLKSRVDVDNAGRVHIDPFLGREPIGLLYFGEKHFAAQFMKRDRSQQEDELPAVQAKNNTARVNGYDAYFGTYSVNEVEGTLTTKLEGAISPANVGDIYIRDVRISDDELIVRLETSTIDGVQVTRTNIFSRVG